jgi:hypothetical protein
VGIDIFDYTRSWLKHFGLSESKNDKAAQKQAKNTVKAHKTKDSLPVEKEVLKKRTIRRNRDEEHGDTE